MQLRPGDALSRYRIEELIGIGGMGEVYRALDTRLGREVAVKVLAARFGSIAEQRARFQREARVISALDHPHVCKLFDLGQTDTADFLVLELLRGETLEARLVGGALPVSDVLRYGSQIADALAAAHGLGVVHRDLKPANIMLTAAGVKLLDFGLAKPIDKAVDLTETLVDVAPVTTQGAAVGTLPYMAPEQVQGLAADARTDLFALGVVLHEMATGRKAFEGRNVASVIAGILGSTPPPASRLRAGVPPALDRLIEMCLSKVPAERWQSADAVRVQLEWLRAQLDADADGVSLSRPPGPAAVVPGRRPDMEGIQLRPVSPAVEELLPAEPYPLLGPYTHSLIFAGRDVEVAALASRVTLPALILSVHAASGTGKSSLLLAGLVPHLRAEGFRVSVDRAPADPLLAQRLLRDLFQPADAVDLKDDAACMWETFARWVAMAHALSSKPTVFVLDQLDDVLRNVERRDQALARLGPLLAATAQRVPGTQGFACKWVLCYRHEFHGEVRAWLADVLAPARALGVSGLEGLPSDLSDALRSHDWVLPVMGKIRRGEHGADSATDAFLRAIVAPLELKGATGPHYPYVISAQDADRLAAAFVRAREEQPDAPLVPELQVVLGHLLQQARQGSGTESNARSVPITVPAQDQLDGEVRYALAQHLERALDSAFPQGRGVASGLSARTRALLALRQLADAEGRRGEGLPEADLIRMIGTDGRQVLDRLSSSDARLIVAEGGRWTLSHDELARVITEMVASRGPILLDQELLDLHLRIGQKLALFQTDPDDASALSLTRKQRQSIRGNRDTLLFDANRQNWWDSVEASRSRRHWQAARWTALALLVVALVTTAGAVALSSPQVWKLTELPRENDSTGFAPRLTTLTVTPDGAHVIGEGSANSFTIWDAASGRAKFRGRGRPMLSGSGQVLLVDPEEDGTYYALNLRTDERLVTPIPAVAGGAAVAIRRNMESGESARWAAAFLNEAGDTVAYVLISATTVEGAQAVAVAPQLLIWSLPERQHVGDLAFCAGSDPVMGMQRPFYLLHRGQRAVMRCSTPDGVRMQLWDVPMRRRLVDLSPATVRVHEKMDAHEGSDRIATTHAPPGAVTGDLIETSSLRVWHAADGTHLSRSVPHGDSRGTELLQPVFSRDGEHVALTMEGGALVQVLRAVDLSVIREFSAAEQARLLQQPTGDRLALWTDPGGLYVWSFDGEHGPVLVPREILPSGFAVQPGRMLVRVSRDRSRIVISTPEDTTIYQTAAESKVATLVGSAGRFEFGATMTLDGTAVVVGREGGGLAMFDLARGGKLGEMGGISTAPSYRSGLTDLEIRVFYDRACERAHVWSTDGRVLRFVKGRSIAGRWFAPAASCSS